MSYLELSRSLAAEWAQLHAPSLSVRERSERSERSPQPTHPSPDEVAWRVPVFRTQIPPTGPIGYLHAKPRTAAHDTPGHCGSCGEPREPELRFCCRACAVAKEIALNAAREEMQ